jgi:hypothetical protein
MFALFRQLVERVKVLFAVSAAQELEADLLLRDAERRAELLRQAERYDAEGLHGIAQHLRQQAEQVSVQRPLAGVLPALAHLQTGLADAPDTPELPAPSNATLPGLDAPSPQALPAPRKKGGRK